MQQALTEDLARAGWSVHQEVECRPRRHGPKLRIDILGRPPSKTRLWWLLSGGSVGFELKAPDQGLGQLIRGLQQASEYMSAFSFRTGDKDQSAFRTLPRPSLVLVVHDLKSPEIHVERFAWAKGAAFLQSWENDRSGRFTTTAFGPQATFEIEAPLTNLREVLRPWRQAMERWARIARETAERVGYPVPLGCLGHAPFDLIQAALREILSSQSEPQGEGGSL